jgi:hypothetical protein
MVPTTTPFGAEKETARPQLTDNVLKKIAKDPIFKGFEIHKGFFNSNIKSQGGGLYTASVAVSRYIDVLSSDDTKSQYFLDKELEKVGRYTVIVKVNTGEELAIGSTEIADAIAEASKLAKTAAINNTFRVEFFIETKDPKVLAAVVSYQLNPF